MSKTAVLAALRKYEMVVIVDARLTNEEKDSILKGLSETVVKAGGKVTSASVWIERQKMTIKIKKCLEGTYFMVNFEDEPDKIIKELGNPWGNDFYLFYKYTRQYVSKPIDEYLYIVH